MDKGKECCDEVSDLTRQLEQQRGMLWVLGEIMKAAVNITSFKQLMNKLTDMLMGVTGVTSCYLWIQMEHSEIQDYTVFYRSVELKDEFKTLRSGILPKVIKDLRESKLYKQEEIRSSLISTINKPGSRLAVPLKDFSDGSFFGALVLEHQKEDFFTNNTIAFFETLSIFIASNAQNSRLLQRVTEKSIKDPLTEIYNRRHLCEAMKSYQSKSEAVSVAIIDTDNFKIINDKMGHIEGDAVLKAIAQLAKGMAQDCDGEVIRYGGDEFVIIIPKGLVESVHILDEFRQSVQYLKVAYDLNTDVTVTLGVCSYPEITDRYDQLIMAADRALLRGKGKGKNRVVLASDEDIELD